MKKSFKRILVIVLGCVMLLSNIGCSGGTDEGQTDTSRTQIYVGRVEDGYGDAWLQAAKVRFEEAYKDYEYNGKKGVEVVIDSCDYGNVIANGLSGNRTEVFYTSDVQYSNLASSGLMKDISSIVKEKLTAFGESESIVDKIPTSLKSYYDYDGTGKYYAIPWTSNPQGIIYDWDLFNDENLFFAGDDSGKVIKDGSSYKFTNSEGNLSAGPDGDLETTYDNGLPQTYEQFFALCDKMVSKGITPITWSGKYTDYVTFLNTALAFDADGIDNANLAFTFNGTHTNLVKTINNDGSIETESKEITPATGYEVYRSAGRYYSLKFTEKLVSNSKYYDATKCFNKSVSHTSAQDNFLNSRVLYPDNPTAMLIDGTHFESEASNTFETIVESKNDESWSKKNRKLGFLPLPHPTDDMIGQKSVWAFWGSSLCFVNANVSDDKMDLIGEFIKFMHTNESLVEYTTISSVVQSYNYTISTEDYAKMSFYGQSVYDLYTHSDITNCFARGGVFELNYGTLTPLYDSYWSSIVGGIACTVPIEEEKNGVSAKSYFEGLQLAYNSSNWSQKINGIS